MNIFFYYDIYVLCFHILMMLFCCYETVSHSKLQLGRWNNILRLTLFHTYLCCRSGCRIWQGKVTVHEGNRICNESDGRMVFVLPYPGDHLNEHHCILMKNSLYYTICECCINGYMQQRRWSFLSVLLSAQGYLEIYEEMETKMKSNLVFNKFS